MTPRFSFIDALRGIACASVVLCHLYANPLQMAFDRAWSGFRYLTYGSAGIEVFFVISGFVVAHSLRDFTSSFVDVGRFIVRRQIRLDPTYWSAMALGGVLIVGGRMAGMVGMPAPSLKTVLLNWTYLQVLTGSRPILLVGWTLCIEIQFYLVFVLLLCLASLLSRVFRLSRAVLVVWTVIIPALISLWLNKTGIQAWFIAYWFYFAAGSLCYWVIQGRARMGYLSVLLLLMAVQSGLHLRLADPLPAIGFLTVITIFAVGKAERLQVWTGGPVLQYLGRISYSLYLVHLPLIAAIFAVAHRLTGDSAIYLLAWTPLALLVSISTAHVLNVAVERPTMRFASRMHRAKPKVEATHIAVGHETKPVVTMRPQTAG